MDLTAKIKDVHIDYVTRKPVISFEVEEEPFEIEKMIDKWLDLRVVLKKKRRSLDSNAYFHVLCDKLRQVLKIPMAECKNHLITSYGQIEYVEEGQPFIYKTNAPPEWMSLQEYIHMELIKTESENVYWYRAYRGSHTYTVDEMQKLLEGTIEECKSQGIETATPDELARMQEMWRRKYGSV